MDLSRTSTLTTVLRARISSFFVNAEPVLKKLTINIAGQNGDKFTLRSVKAGEKNPRQFLSNPPMTSLVSSTNLRRHRITRLINGEKPEACPANFFHSSSLFNYFKYILLIFFVRTYMQHYMSHYIHYTFLNNYWLYNKTTLLFVLSVKYSRSLWQGHHICKFYCRHKQHKYD
jgi:hypothetical protein